MGLSFENLDDLVRAFMVEEIDMDEKSEKISLSVWLTQSGQGNWADALRAAARTGNDDSLAAEVMRSGMLTKQIQKRKPKGGYRVDPHMSIPIAFAFDFQKVITLPNSGFVPGNFAKTGAAALTGDSEFNKMQFELIYHDSALSQDRMAEVHNWRMSEVVVMASLPLSNLSYVICRSPHEERTFRYALGNHAAPKIIVEQKGSIFMRRGMFIDEIYWAANLLHMNFHGPTGFTKDRYTIKVTCWDGAAMHEMTYLAAPGRYHFPGITASKDAVWRIELEDCVVYHAPIPSMSGLVVS